MAGNVLGNVCDPVQKSVEWCEGRSNYAGIRRRMFFLAMSQILTMPKVPLDSNGRPTSGVLTGEFVLREGATFFHMDIVPEKSQATSQSQGDYPNQTSLDKVSLFHQGTDANASAAAAYFHNTRNVVVFEDTEGRARVMGIEDAWPAKSTVNQDFGQGPTGAAGTTFEVEATAKIPFPEYRGKLMTDLGEIDYSKNL